MHVSQTTRKGILMHKFPMGSGIKNPTQIAEEYGLN